MKRAASIAILGAAASAALWADLASKRWAEHALDAPRSIVDGVVVFALAKNPGGAWSLFHDASDAVRVPFFVGVSVVALAALVMMLAGSLRAERPGWALRAGLALVVGGAVGNLADRLRYGYVIDFIELHARWHDMQVRWPTFNVADVAIVVGVALVVVDRTSWGARARVAA